MGRLSFLLVAAVFVAGCAQDYSAVQLDPSRAEVRPVESLPEGIEVVEVQDERGTDPRVLGTARRGGRPSEMRSARSLPEVVQEMLELLLEGGTPSQPVKATIDWLDVQETHERGALRIKANVALRFAVGDPAREYSTQHRADIAARGNSMDEIEDALFEAIRDCAEDLALQMSGQRSSADAMKPLPPPPSPRVRRFVLTAGIGIDTSGVGFGAEWHFGEAQSYSITAGVGQRFLGEPEWEDYLQVWSWMAGVRYYLDGGKHRMFAQAMTGPTEWLYTATGEVGNVDYEVLDESIGGGFGMGYKYTAHTGFTFPVSLNLIYAPESHELNPSLSLSMGYSF